MSWHKEQYAAAWAKVTVHVAEHKIIYSIAAAAILVFLLGRYSAN